MAGESGRLDGTYPDDIATLWFLIRRASALLDRSGDALFREGVGVSLAQFLVLSVVDAFPGPVKQQAIADRLGLTKGTVSRQIEAAVAAGLMTADPAEHSRREHALRLTPRGTELVRRGDALMRQAATAQLPDLDPGDLAATLRVLGVLSAALDK